MKDLETLYAELKARPDFEVTDIFINGGMGIFVRGPYKRKTVIWSYDSGWDHVSFDGKLTTPSWEDMCMIKDMFFDENECVAQFHPAKSDYVNIAEHCLHLWKPQDDDFENPQTLPIPPMYMV